LDAEARVHASMTQERREGILADLLVRTTIGSYNQFFLLDFICATIHSDSNIQYAFKKVGDGCFVHQGGVADHTKSEKNTLYYKWDHIEGFGLVVMRPPAKVSNILFPLLVTLW
jgi:hypothetical protein